MHSLYLLFVGHPSETNYLATDDIKNISTSMKYVPKIQTFHQNSALIWKRKSLIFWLQLSQGIAQFSWHSLPYKNSIQPKKLLIFSITNL